MKLKYPKIVQSPNFKPICHHCGMIGHIRPYCHKLNIVSSSHTYNQPRNQYDRLKNQIRVLTMNMNRFVFKLRQVFTNHDQKGNHNAKVRPKITLTPHEFIGRPKMTIMWVRKSNFKSLRTPKKFVRKNFVE